MRLAPRLVALGLILAASTAFAGPKKGGYVTINCPVVGATILIDGQEIGVVPMEQFELRFGNHVIQVQRKGLIDFRTDVVLRPGQTIVVNAMPQKPAALLTVATNVKGGEVLLDGKSLGPLPLQERSITPGRHSLIIRKRGLKAYQESFLIGPHREYTSRPTLMKTDGTMAGGLLDLDLDEELDLEGPTVAAAPSGGLDLELELDEPVAVAAAKPSGGLALELDLELPTAPPPAAPPPAQVAAAPPPPPTKVAVARPAPAKTATEDFGALPGLEQKPVAVAAAEPPPASSAFVIDPIARAEVEEAQEPGDPLYMNKWVWVGTGAAVVAAVAIPILTGYTGGYQEVRNPEAACRDCLVVMNR